MRQFYFLVFCLGVNAFALQAQNKIKGQLNDAEGNPIFAANIYCLANPQQGTTSDFDGFFELSPCAVSDSILISFIGFEKKVLAFSSLPKNDLLVVELKPVSKVLEAVSISATVPISEAAAVVKMKKLDIYLNAASAGDALKAVSTLASSSNTEETANPSLRGGSSSRSRVVLNGVPIYRPVRNSQLNGIGNFSIFNTEMIDNMYVYPSNPPLTYGNSSGGIIELQTIEKLEQNSISASATLASVGFFLSQKINETSLVQVFGNYQFSDAFVVLNKKSLERLNAFGSTDAGINFHTSGKKWKYNFFAYAIEEAYDFTASLYADTDNSLADKKRVYVVNNYSIRLGNGEYSLNSGINISKTNFKFGNINSNQRTTQVFNSLNYKVFLGERTKLQLGLSSELHRDFYRDSLPSIAFNFNASDPKYFELNELKRSNTDVFAYATQSLSKEINLNIGARYNFNAQVLSYQLSSRIDLLAKQSLLLSAGSYYSYEVPSSFNKSYALLNSKQFALDYAYVTSNGRISAACFFKKNSGGQSDENRNIICSNSFRGLEFFAKRYFGNSFIAEVSNLLLDHRQEIGGKEFRGNSHLNYFIKSSVQFRAAGLFNLSINYSMRPGSYYTAIEGSWFDAQNNARQPIFSEDFNAAQYASYNRMDLGLSKYIPLAEQSVLFFVSLANVLNKHNESYLTFNADYSRATAEYYQLRTIYFGMVWSLNY